MQNYLSLMNKQRLLSEEKGKAVNILSPLTLNYCESIISEYLLQPRGLS